jgi:hypothetical protein
LILCRVEVIVEMPHFTNMFLSFLMLLLLLFLLSALSEVIIFFVGIVAFSIPAIVYGTILRVIIVGILVEIEFGVHFSTTEILS